MNLQRRFQSALAALPVRKAVLFITALVVALHLGLSLFAWTLAQHEIVPVLEQKAYATGLAEARRLTRRLAGGESFDALQGVQQQFDETLRRNPDLAYIILTDTAGRILVRSGSGGEVFTPERYSAVTREVERRLVTYGQVHVGIDRQFIVARMKAVRVDATVILLASLLLAAGLASYAANQAFGQPVGQLARVLARMAAGDFRFRIGAGSQELQRAIGGVLARVNDAYAELLRSIPAGDAPARALASYDRLRTTHQFAEGAGGALTLAVDRATPLLLAFLCLLAEALSRPALAHHAADLAAYRAAIPASLRAGVAVGALYLAAAMALPMAAHWIARAGRRNTYAAGCLLMLLGFGAGALVDDAVTLVLGRVLSGVGLALAASAALDEGTVTGERRGGSGALALFAIAALAAEACGAALGGIFDRLGGMQAIMMASAALAGAAAPIGYRLLAGGAEPARQRDAAPRHRRLPGGAPAAPAPKPAQGKPAPARPAHWIPFAILQAAAQLPAAAAYGAFPAILLPLALHAAGFVPAEAGRYGLLLAALALATVPLFLRLAYRSNRYALVAVLGAALLGAGIGPLSVASNTARHPAAILALLAAGMLLMFGTQLVLAQRATRAAEFRLGALPPAPFARVAACLAAAAGALGAGLAVRAYGPADAAAAAGSLALMAGAGFMLLYLLVVALPGGQGSGTIKPH